MYDVASRTWGEFIVTDVGPGYKIKYLFISPGASLSHQRHQSRDEHWYVLSGHGVVKIDDIEYPLLPGTQITVKRNCWHLLTNLSSYERLVIHEIQSGNVCEEADIERRWE